MRASHYFLLGVILILLPAPAAAAGVELIPYFGFRLGDGFIEGNDVVDLSLDEGAGYGFIVAFPRPDDRGRIELLWSRQQTEIEIGGFLAGNPLLDVTVDYLHLGGYYQWGDGRHHPFALGSFGLTRINPESGFDSEYDFSIGFGGGVRLDLSDRIGLRFEGRSFWSLGGTGAATFNDGMTIVVYEGSDFLWQFEASAGVVFTLGKR